MAYFHQNATINFKKFFESLKIVQDTIKIIKKFESTMLDVYDAMHSSV
jgi:hypothetical protein